MRKLIVSSLFLSAALIQAQHATKGSTLEARNEAPATPVAVAASSATPTALPLRVSTGVVGAKVLAVRPFSISISEFPKQDVSNQKVVVLVHVGTNGAAQDVELKKSVNPSVDAAVMAAVRNYKFAPAMLDNQAVDADLELTVNFEQR